MVSGICILNRGYTVKVEPTEFADELDVQWERERITDDSKGFGWTSGRKQLPWES